MWTWQISNDINHLQIWIQNKLLNNKDVSLTWGFSSVKCIFFLRVMFVAKTLNWMLHQHSANIWKCNKKHLSSNVFTQIRQISDQCRHIVQTSHKSCKPGFPKLIKAIRLNHKK